MTRLLTDLCESAGYLADLVRIVLVDVVRTARTTGRSGPVAGPDERPTDLARGHIRRTVVVREDCRPPGGEYRLG